MSASSTSEAGPGSIRRSVSHKTSARSSSSALSSRHYDSGYNPSPQMRREDRLVSLVDLIIMKF